MWHAICDLPLNVAHRQIYLAIWWCSAVVIFITIVLTLWKFGQVATMLIRKNGTAILLEAECHVIDKGVLDLDDLQGICNRNPVDLFVYSMLAQKIRCPETMSQLLLCIQQNYLESDKKKLEPVIKRVVDAERVDDDNKNGRIENLV